MFLVISKRHFLCLPLFRKKALGVKRGFLIPQNSDVICTPPTVGYLPLFVGNSYSLDFVNCDTEIQSAH